mmetsp:Transcript_11868/g.16081  ORF Transcript_11868/g.16081 Transcript_11868/m.16081 type:complete len:215 (-) Transcript_11868:1074-1718(-)
MLVDSKELASGVSVQLGQQHGEAGAVARESLVRDQVVRHPLRSQLHWRLTHRQRVSLGKEVAHELVVVGHNLALEVDGLLGLDGTNEVAGDDTALVDELVEGVLAVSSGLAKVNLPSSVRNAVTVHVHALAIGLHGHLLDVGCQLGQSLRVRQDCALPESHEGHIPNAQKPQHDREVLPEWCGSEVVVDVPGSGQELLSDPKAVVQRQGQNAHG